MQFTIICSLFLVILALPARSQEATDSTDPLTPFSIEARGGANSYGGMATFEGRFSLFEALSLDVGMRAAPRGFYGGISVLPFYPFLLQVQSGTARVQDALIDGPSFQSDFFGGFRTGVLVGKNSGLRFSATVGGMMLVDFDYCENCGFIIDPGFAPRYRDEVRWTPTIEFGIGARL